jgi:hypothetical protein
MNEEQPRAFDPKGAEGRNKKRKNDTDQTAGASASSPPSKELSAPGTLMRTQAELNQAASKFAKHPSSHETAIPEEQRVKLMLTQIESALDHATKLSDYYVYPSALCESVKRLALVVCRNEDNSWDSVYAPDLNKTKNNEDAPVTLRQLREILQEFKHADSRGKSRDSEETQGRNTDSTPTSTSVKKTGPNTSFATGPVYKPTPPTRTNNSTNQTTTTTPTKRDPRSAHHPSRLVVQCSHNPREVRTEYELQKAINDRLRRDGAATTPYVVSIKFNQRGNIIVSVREDQLAKELLARWDDIEPAFEGLGTKRPTLDAEWHAVQIHGVNAGPRGMVHSIEEVMAELTESNPGLNLDNLAKPISWMKRDIELLQQTRSSVRLIFKQEEEAKALIKRGFVYAFGVSCEVTRHANRAPGVQCRDCWSTEHTKPCKTIKCRLCAGPHREAECALVATRSGEDAIMETEEAPTLRCANCEGSHSANDRKCPKMQDVHKTRQDNTRAQKTATTATTSTRTNPTLSQETFFNTLANATTVTLGEGATFKPVKTKKKKPRKARFADEQEATAAISSAAVEGAGSTTSTTTNDSEGEHPEEEL